MSRLRNGQDSSSNCAKDAQANLIASPPGIGSYSREFGLGIAGECHDGGTVAHRRIKKVARTLYLIELRVGVDLAEFDAKPLRQQGLLQPQFVKSGPRRGIDVGNNLCGIGADVSKFVDVLF